LFPDLVSSSLRITHSLFFGPIDSFAPFSTPLFAVRVMRGTGCFGNFHVRNFSAIPDAEL
jgi:hypothetical protein